MPERLNNHTFPIYKPLIFPLRQGHVKKARISLIIPKLYKQLPQRVNEAGNPRASMAIKMWNMPVNSTPVENRMVPPYFLLLTLAAKSSSIAGVIRGNFFSINLYNFPFTLRDFAIQMMPANSKNNQDQTDPCALKMPVCR